MKKIVGVMLAALILTQGIVGIGAQGNPQIPYVQTLFSDEFTGYTAGTNVPAGTYYFNGTLIPNPMVQNYGGKYGNVMEITGNALNSWCGPLYTQVTNHYNEDNPLKKVSLEFDICLNSLFNIGITVLDLIPSDQGGGGFMTLASFSASGELKLSNTGKTLQYQAGTWYHFKIELDYTKHTQTVYINDKMELEEVSMPVKTHTAFKHLRFSINTNATASNKVLVDNIRYLVPYQGTEPAICLQEDGEGYRVKSVVGKEYAQNPVMVIAAYRNGKMQKVSLCHGTEFLDATAFDVGYTPHMDDKIQVFMLENLHSIKPLCSSENVSIYLPEHFQQTKERWREYLVGYGDNPLDNPYVANRISYIDANAKTSQNTMNRTENPKALWGESISTTANMTTQYGSIYRMAQAWGTYGSIFYHDEGMKQDIKYALQWGYENLYGEDEIHGRGWRKTSLFNWWDWYVGVPQYLTNTLLIMESEFSKEEITEYLSLFRHVINTMKVENIRSNISSRSYNVLAAAMLWEDASLAADMIRNYNVLFSYVTKESGMYEDYSYLTHNNVAYTGSYGTDALLNRIVAVISITDGTPFEITNPNKHRIEEWVLNAFEPLMYNGGMMSMVNGRSVGTSSEHTRGTVVIRSALDLMDAASPADSYRLKMLIKRHLVKEIEEYVYRTLSVKQIIKLEELLEDPNVGEPQGYILNKVFYNMDRVVHHRQDFAVGISMSSSRIANYESINGANATGWYHSDGMLYLYNSNDVAQYNINYFKFADPYKMPGTTVDTQIRKAVNISGGKEYFSNQDFVGGVSMQGKYGVTAMYLESFHNNKVDNSVPTESGGPQPLHQSTLFAQKAWFLFDDEVVALGSGIRANDGYSVRTIVENRKLYSASNGEKILVNGVAASKTNELLQSTQAARWAYIEGTGGYYFPAGGNLFYQRRLNSSNRFFEMWLDHGVNPDNQTYGYVLLPNQTSAQTQSYADDPHIEILQNTKQLQVVREKNLNVTGMVFWEAGAYGEFNTTQPLIVMMQEENGIYRLSIADPTHKLDHVRIEIQKNLTLLSADDAMTVIKGSGGTTIQVDLSNVLGESLTAEFIKE